MFLVTEALCIE